MKSQSLSEKRSELQTRASEIDLDRKNKQSNLSSEENFLHISENKCLDCYKDPY